LTSSVRGGEHGMQVFQTQNGANYEWGVTSSASRNKGTQACSWSRNLSVGVWEVVETKNDRKDLLTLSLQNRERKESNTRQFEEKGDKTTGY